MTFQTEGHHTPLYQTTKNVKKSLRTAEEYNRAAVATDHETCSNIGKDILQRGGSAVDATIAALFCLGTVQFQSTGIGGGGFLQYYERKTKKMHVFDFRETLPAKNNENIYDRNRQKTMRGWYRVKKKDNFASALVDINCYGSRSHPVTNCILI